MTALPDSRPTSTGSDTGAAMVAFMEDLFPICRSITGDGLRESLRMVGKVVPLDITEVPSGTPVLDWVVPPEWNIRAGWLADPSGRRVADFERSNLHIVNYSVPVRRRPQPRGASSAPAQPARSPLVGALPNLLLRTRIGASAWPTMSCGPCHLENTRPSSTRPSRPGA